MKYTQGLNELIAPFFVLNLERGEIFNAFYALIQKFVPNTLRGHDLKTLRRRFVLIFHKNFDSFGAREANFIPDFHTF